MFDIIVYEWKHNFTRMIDKSVAPIFLNSSPVFTEIIGIVIYERNDNATRLINKARFSIFFNSSQSFAESKCIVIVIN